MSESYDKSISFTVPGIPHSYTRSLRINHNQRHTYLSKSANNFKDLVALHVPKWDLPDDRAYIFHLTNTFYNDWYYKNGKVKRQDVQNLDRLLIDAIFKRIGLDDKYLWQVTNKKEQLLPNEEPRTHICLVIEDERHPKKHKEKYEPDK